AADAVLATYPDRDILVEFPQVPWPVPDVLGDPDLLVVALYNVISNAAKYSDADAHIEVRASEADGWVSVDISDTGWGIPEKDMQIIWEELARGSDTRGAQGSGLGLAIVRVIAERHGGSAALRSSPGQGTRVTLRLRAAS
ncbi:MAG: sensor histidine kinase, partial [Ancrocorticia sp.]